MPELTIQAGAKMFVPSRAEMREDMRAVWDDRERERARGYKWLRLPHMTGTAAGSAITMGIASGSARVGPEQGYIWTLRRLVVSGMTTGTTPDVINLYRNDAFAGPPLWQFNGNNFGYTFGRMELVLMGGDTLSLQNSGTFAATGIITLSGEAEEVPAEMQWKLDR